MYDPPSGNVYGIGIGSADVMTELDMAVSALAVSARRDLDPVCRRPDGRALTSSGS